MREWRETILEMFYHMSSLIHCLIKKDVEGGGGVGGGWVGVFLAVRADLAILSLWSFIPFCTKRT